MLSLAQLETFLFASRKWLPGPIIFVVLLIILFAMRRVLLHWIARAIEHRGQRIDALVRALSPSLGVTIVVASLAVAIGFEPIPPTWRVIADAILTGGIILALIVLVDGLLMFWMHRGAARYPVLGESYGIVAGFVRGIVFGIGVLTFLESIGISVGPILATLGIGSLAIALALQETLKNTLSGLFLVVDSPVQVGDYVKLSSGQEGWLTQLGWRSSKFRMMNDNIVIVPNSQLVDAIFTNLRARDGALSIEIDLNVAGGSDLERVERVTNEIASTVMAAVDGASTRFAPSVYFQSLSASSIGMAVFLRILRSADIEKTKHEFIKRVTERFAKEDIKLA
jgi:small-conductance mechanosensitive channel